MSYIGQSPTSTAFLADTFSGTGSQTAFTMAVAPGTSTAVLITISGVVQSPDTYSVSGLTLTFTGAPPSGTNNISVRYLGIPASGISTPVYKFPVANYQGTQTLLALLGNSYLPFFNYQGTPANINNNLS